MRLKLTGGMCGRIDFRYSCVMIFASVDLWSAHLAELFLWDRALQTILLNWSTRTFSVCAFRKEINLPCLRILFRDKILLHVIYPNENIINAHRIDAETEDCSLVRDLLRNIRPCCVLTLYSPLLWQPEIARFPVFYSPLQNLFYMHTYIHYITLHTMDPELVTWL
jgi:hypothetical protein